MQQSDQHKIALIVQVRRAWRWRRRTPLKFGLWSSWGGCGWPCERSFAIAIRRQTLDYEDYLPYVISEDEFGSDPVDFCETSYTSVCLCAC